MSTNHFPDPYEIGHTDVRLKPDADEAPPDVLAAYGLENATVTRLTTGSYNIHFRVESDRGTFDLRRSNRPIDTSNLLYESELLAHLRERGFTLAPELVPTAEGESNYWSSGDGWTLFRWIDQQQDMTVTPGRIESAGETLAALHRATDDFTPAARRGDWPIFCVPEEWVERWAHRCESLADHLGDEGFRRMSRQSNEEMSQVDFASLATLGCHADYRMRNLRFDGEKVSTIFDFDTAIVATRMLDLGGAATRFSPVAGAPQADIESGTGFLRAYNSAYALTEYEWKLLPAFIRWRLIRDLAIYYDRWWNEVEGECGKLFTGAAEEMVERARG